MVPVVKNPSANTGAAGEKRVLSLGQQDPLNKGTGNPLQYSCLGNPMGRGPWQAAVHRVAQSQTGLKWLGTHTHIPYWIVTKVTWGSNICENCFQLWPATQVFLVMHLFQKSQRWIKHKTKQNWLDRRKTKMTPRIYKSLFLQLWTATEKEIFHWVCWL